MATMSCTSTVATTVKAAVHEEHVHMQHTLVVEAAAANKFHYEDAVVLA